MLAAREVEETSLRIRELPRPVTAAKADWLAATSWVGFTPPESTLHSREQRRASISRQIQNGYVIEYITRTIDLPNVGFEADPKYLEDRDNHRPLAGRLIAVHRLISSAKPLAEILGHEAYQRLQDMWAKGAKRHRWSIAFPIVESYSIRDTPLATDVFLSDAMKRVFAHPSGTLRPLVDEERMQIAELEIEPRRIENPWLGIDAEAAMAVRSQVDPRIQRMIDRDLTAALEGMTEERKTKIRKRAALIAQRFLIRRTKAGQLRCDECPYDPTAIAEGTSIRPRTLLDVHHKTPLEEGVRLTTEMDFCLLCPNCHRFIHALARMAHS
jgi:5-methylcytosine-specific restriction enzyme A